MAKTKRLFYVPGLISLIGLAITLPHFYQKNSPVKQGFLPLFVPKDCNNEYDGSYDYSTCYLEKEIRNKKQLTIRLEENKAQNIRKLNIIRDEALRLKYFDDTSTVIVVTLSDSIGYGDFVYLVDICNYDEHKKFGFWKNRFAIWGEWPKTDVKPDSTITPLYCGTKPFRKPGRKPSFFETLFNKIKDNYTEKGLYLCIGFTALLVSFFISRKTQK